MGIGGLGRGSRILLFTSECFTSFTTAPGTQLRAGFLNIELPTGKAKVLLLSGSLLAVHSEHTLLLWQMKPARPRLLLCMLQGG